MAALDAAKACGRARAAVRDYPDLPSAHRVLALTLRRLGNVSEAERVELKAIELGLRVPAVAAAEKAYAEDRLEEAEQLIRPYLRENPEDPGGALILGSIAQRCGAAKEAENLFRRAILLAPAYLEARMILAKLLNESGRYDEGLASLEEILSRDRQHLAALSLKATVLVQYRRLAEAKPVLERLLRVQPDDVLTWTGYAHLLKTTGEIGEAIAAYRKAVELESGRGIAWWSMANLKTFVFSADDIEKMRSGLKRDDINDEDRLHLHFALGKALDDAGDHAAAFAHYAQGNALRWTQKPHDPEIIHRNVQKAERTFTPAFFSARANAGCPARDPIFIVSLPRSGSTLVEQILASHPAIEGTEELYDIERIALDLSPGEPAGSYMDKLENLSHVKLHELGRHYIEATRRHRHTDRPHFTDKMPSNWVFTGFIHAILPNAKIIDIRRHPLGCGFANFAQHYSRGINFSYDLESTGRFYADYVRQMAHFDRVAPGLVHRIFYENLVEDLEGEVRRLLDYLELPFDEACLRFHENKRAVHTPSSEQVRRPINRDGMERWRNYEPWLGPLKDALGPVLDRYPDVPEKWRD
jgi:tetratricopeptide (TPR) repeat protein